MAYDVQVGDITRRIEIEEAGPGQVRFVLDGTPLEVGVEQPAPGLMHLRFGDRSTEVWLAAMGGHWEVVRRGVRYTATVTDDRQRLLGRLGGSRPATGPVRVESQMPGKVVALLVAEGQAVAAGAGLVVVEAMKMENELRSPIAGVVQRVAATAGAAVEAGQLLVELAPTAVVP